VAAVNDPIDLVETAPGQWSFVRLMRLARPARSRHSQADIEARREAFFNSLASEPNPPRPYRWWEGWAGLCRVYFGGLALLVIIVTFGQLIGLLPR
jgi:hypothetical protein